MTGPAPDSLEDLSWRVAGLEDGYKALTAVIESAADTITADATEEPDHSGAHEKPKPAGLDLAALDTWVRTWFLPTFRRMEGGANHRWCPQWWSHAEAVLRLEATRTAYNTMTAAGGAGVAAWLREVLDVQLPHLFADDGPFGQCKVEPAKHVQRTMLPAVPVPRELLDEIAAGQNAQAVLADPTFNA